MLRDVPKERDPLTDTPAPVTSEANRAKRTAEQGASRRAPGRAPGSAYWLIAKNENGRLEVIATRLAGAEEALPVFSHEEEAEMFLQLRGVDDGWQTRESTAGELISVLYGPCASVERVALDPLPEMLVERTFRLVCLSRKRFVDLVLSREQPLARKKG